MRETRAAVAWGLTKPSRRVLCPGGHPPSSRERASPIPTSPTGHGSCTPTPRLGSPSRRSPASSCCSKPVCTLHSSQPDVPAWTRPRQQEGTQVHTQVVWSQVAGWRGSSRPSSGAAVVCGGDGRARVCEQCACLPSAHVSVHVCTRVSLSMFLPSPHAGSGLWEGFEVLGSPALGREWGRMACWAPWAGSSRPCCLWVGAEGQKSAALAPGSPGSAPGACFLWKAANILGAVLRTHR